MRQIIRSDRAAEDLITILMALGRRSEIVASRFAEQFDRKCQKLLDFPHLGESCEHLGPGLRQFPVWSYLVIYRDVSTGIEIARVVHGARDVESLFDATEIPY